MPELVWAKIFAERALVLADPEEHLCNVDTDQEQQKSHLLEIEAAFPGYSKYMQFAGRFHTGTKDWSTTVKPPRKSLRSELHQPIGISFGSWNTPKRYTNCILDVIEQPYSVGT